MRSGAIDLPAWTEPWIGGALLAVALALLVIAVRAAMKRGSPPRKRWGNAVGAFGVAVFLSGMGSGLLLGADLVPGPMIVCVAGFVLIAIGGVAAGWTSSGIHR